MISVGSSSRGNRESVFSTRQERDVGDHQTSWLCGPTYSPFALLSLPFSCLLALVPSFTHDIATALMKRSAGPGETDDTDVMLDLR